MGLPYLTQYPESNTKPIEEIKLENAAKNKDLYEMEKLCSIINVDKYGDSALMEAIDISDMKMISLILKNKKDLSCENNSVLRLNIVGGSIAISEHLLKCGVTIKEYDELAICAYNNDVERVKLLKKYGANLNYENCALYAACDTGALKVIQYLIEEEGVDPNLVLSDENPNVEKSVLDWVRNYKKIIDFKGKLEDNLSNNNLLKSKLKL